MRVLVACEFSGTVRDAFAERGHDAWSCDLLASETAGNHYQGPVQDILAWRWDLLIAHPPCTYLANSGVSHLHKDPDRWQQLDDGAAFFKLFLDAPIARKCIENPIMHKYARERIGGIRPTQIVQPWMFGHPEQKATCLWLDGLMPLRETDNVKEHMLTLPNKDRQRLHYLSPSPDRWRERSKTFQGLANAMAAQWG